LEPHPEDQGGDKLLRPSLERTQVAVRGVGWKYLASQRDFRFQ